MPGNFYPDSDQELNAWVANFNTNLAAVMTSLTLPATFDDAILAAKTAYSTALTAHVAAQTASFNARQTKDAARTTMVDELRNLVRQLRANPGFTDPMAVSLGLPIYDTVATPTVPGSETPSLSVDNGSPQTHIISFWQMGDSGGETTEQIAKPQWARALRIVRSVVESGEPCPAVELMGWLASDTASPYMVTYTGTAVGKDAYYRGAWETHTGQIGLWSEAVKATITG